MNSSRKKPFFLYRFFRFLWRKFLFTLKHMRGSPHEIAGGGAVGIFIAVTPTFGFQSLLALFVATVARVNRIAALLFVWVTNIFTVIPIYFVVCYIGKLFLSRRIQYEAVENISWTEFSSVWTFFCKHFLALWVGSFILGIIGSVIIYYLLFYTVISLRKIKKHT